MNITNTIKVIKTPTIEGKIVLELTPKEAFIIRKALGNLNYENILEYCNDGMLAWRNLSGKGDITYDECRNILYTIYESIKLAFEK
jgi:hypothetical protein